ncbi:MAG TPA: PA2779 family protein [Burkholderiales bacterium]
MIALFRRLIACLLMVSVPAQASLIGTESVNVAGSRERVVAFLERADVQLQMESLGVSPQDVKARVASLSDAEVASLAGKIDSLPAGGDAVGAVLWIALVVFLVLLITDILGLTKVFPFTKPMKR